jgi:hypothetical protein
VVVSADVRAGAASLGVFTELDMTITLALTMLPLGGALATGFLTRSRLQTKKVCVHAFGAALRLTPC